MKKSLIINILILIIISFSIIGCNKGKTDTDKIPEDKLKSLDKVTVYTKTPIYVYEKEEEIGKKTKNVKFCKMATEVKVLGSKTIGDKDYYKIKLLLSDEPCWAAAENFCERFIVIEKDEILTYDDAGNVTTVKLMKGDLGYLIEERSEFLKVEFRAYRPYKSDGDKKWVGTRWIRDGYSTQNELLNAKMAYYLYLAYYYELQKNDLEKAIENLDAALEENVTGETTFMTDVINQYYDYLNSKSGGEASGKVETSEEETENSEM